MSVVMSQALWLRFKKFPTCKECSLSSCLHAAGAQSKTAVAVQSSLTFLALLKQRPPPTLACFCVSSLTNNIFIPCTAAYIAWKDVPLSVLPSWCGTIGIRFVSLRSRFTAL